MVARDLSSVDDACSNAMTVSNLHEWVRVRRQNRDLDTSRRGLRDRRQADHMLHLPRLAEKVRRLLRLRNLFWNAVEDRLEALEAVVPQMEIIILAQLK